MPPSPPPRSPHSAAQATTRRLPPSAGSPADLADRPVRTAAATVDNRGMSYLRLRLARRLGLLGPTLRFDRRVETALLNCAASEPRSPRQAALAPASRPRA